VILGGLLLPFWILVKVSDKKTKELQRFGYGSSRFGHYYTSLLGRNLNFNVFNYWVYDVYIRLESTLVTGKIAPSYYILDPYRQASLRQHSSLDEFIRICFYSCIVFSKKPFAIYPTLNTLRYYFQLRMRDDLNTHHSFGITHF